MAWIILAAATVLVLIVVWIKTVQQGEQLTGKDRQGIAVPYH